MDSSLRPPLAERKFPKSCVGILAAIVASILIPGVAQLNRASIWSRKCNWPLPLSETLKSREWSPP